MSGSIPDPSTVILRQIRDGWHDALRAHGGTLEVGPYLCTFEQGTDLIWVNYATPKPDSGLQSFRDALPTLRRAFIERSRTIRFESFDALDPGLAPLLQAEGIALHMRLPIMVCTRAELAVDPTPAGLSLERLTPSSPDDLLRQFVAARDAGFGPLSAEPIEAQVAGLRREIEAGTSRPVLARMDGQAAGVGTLMGRGTVCELGGVATVPDFRGRGVARSVSQSLAALQLADERANAVWLTAGSDVAQRVYERIGFRLLGWQSTYVDQAWLDAQPASS